LTTNAAKQRRPASYTGNDPLGITVDELRARILEWVWQHPHYRMQHTHVEELIEEIVGS